MVILTCVYENQTNDSIHFRFFKVVSLETTRTFDLKFCWDVEQCQKVTLIWFIVQFAGKSKKKYLFTHGLTI